MTVEAKEIIESEKYQPTTRDRAYVANQLLELLIQDQDTVNATKLAREAKPGVIKEVLELIGKPDRGSEEHNELIAQALIRALHEEKDPLLRTRFASVISHDLQQQYLPDQSAKEIDMAVLENFLARRNAFGNIANNEKLNSYYRIWANHLLKGEGHLAVLNNLLDKDPGGTEIIQPMEHEFKDIIDRAGEGAERKEGEQMFTGNERWLHPDFLPSPEKCEWYKKHTGKDLPVAFTWRVGEKREVRKLPSAYVAKCHEALKAYRAGDITRQELDESVMDIYLDFKKTALSSQERAELEQIEKQAVWPIRYSTEVSDIVASEDAISEPDASDRPSAQKNRAA